MHFDPVVVLNHFVAPGVAEPSTMGGANAQERSLDKRIRSRIAFFVESSTSEKKCLAEAKKRDGVGVYNNLFFENAREQLLGQLRRKCWNLMAKDKVMELIEKFIDLGRSEGAEIARTECGKYGKTSRNVFNQKIDYAPAEVSTRYGILGRCSRGCKPDGTQLGFGRYGTKSCRAGRLSYRAIEAARRAIIGHFHRAMSGQFRRNGKIWVRVLADIPITGKPTEVRMGRGKGNPTGWIARVSTGQILFEMDGVSLSNARQAATLAAHKLCSSTKFVQWS
ncbi:UNVERIFIED_CONTAM: 60S ribosomal protein L16, mitochondrial [Sesamum calycinum]|uniref:60S ribosomal protein L16, mitochondrial n=1 Tax=Sesamum calycinum TaxID=2727403 RepID=A0AAW2K0W0_9LAMI